MTKKKSMQSMSYEEAFQELETIVQQLESGDLPLEESLDFFERGQSLGKYCSDLLEKAELTLKKLAPSESGAFAEVDFSLEEE